MANLELTLAVEEEEEEDEETSLVQDSDEENVTASRPIVPLHSYHQSGYQCIDMDKALYKTAFALRAVADFSYFVDLLVRLIISKTIWQSCILIDILAILPLPQGWRFLNIAMLINSLVMVQYVPRILRIYFACKELKESFNERIGLWIKSVLNFLLYILASHVLGAFWYFFAIQRMKTCWQLACQLKLDVNLVVLFAMASSEMSHF
ncbi:unnamed protein product [Prunus armeniaca]|uniref:Uncharacterized protein n=1 Tax=Prunus armeniaca TaxID=36596 RepID=A0A6J5U382_PRUAR|nr:unnamed protein product [Prunus armeniaca]